MIRQSAGKPQPNRAKRLECAQLAAAFVQAHRPKRQQAGALQTLRDKL